MSTRATLVSGSTFHLFEEVLDEEHVYLELEATAFEATPERVCVQIPLPVWEVIRGYSPFDDSLADLDEAALYAKVEAEVDERIKAYHKNNRTGLFGIFVFGPADSPREEQLEQGLTWHKEKRARQRRLREAIQQRREHKPA